MIKVLIVEDSFFISKILTKILETDPEIKVIGVAKNGETAVKMTKDLHPDVVTMDIRMPVMNGFEATKQIMVEKPTPILVVSSSVNDEDLKISFNAIQAGALDIVEKPAGNFSMSYEEIGAELIKKIKLIAEIKVFRHLSSKLQGSPRLEKIGKKKRFDTRVIAIGASTGGPSALLTVLQGIPKEFSASILIAQHISESFALGCVEWLNNAVDIKVKMACDGEIMKEGVAYFIHDGKQLQVNKAGQLILKDNIKGKSFSLITIMMKSIAECFGPKAIGVILTGMGDDGALGMKAIKESGGRTVAQDEKSSVVFGMPKVAIEMGIIDKILPLENISDGILEML